MIVKGRVQGVSYRFFTLQLANMLNITGWVKNLDNGDVEIVAQGSDMKLKQFIEQLWRGPEGANVEDIIIEEQKPNPMKSFIIRT